MGRRYDCFFMLYCIGLLLVSNYISNILNKCYTLIWDGESIMVFIDDYSGTYKVFTE